VAVVTAAIDLGDLLWDGYTTGWLVVITIAAPALAVSLAWRRRRPSAALAVAGLGYGVVWAISLWEFRMPSAMAQAAVWVVAFSAIAEGTVRLRLTGIALLGAYVVMVTYASIRMSGTGAYAPAMLAYDAVSVSFIPVVVVAAADAVRGRVQLATAQADQAERLRELDARAAAHDERLRLARELHDVVANRLSAVAMRITAAGHVHGPPHTPESEALAEIGQEVDSALGELRSVLGTLRDDQAAVDAAALPSLHHLETLAEQVRRTGAQVAIEISGKPCQLSSMVDLAAYRIVQEALANVTRHAYPPHATVSLDYGPDSLRIRIDDDGADQTGRHFAQPPGHGIIGIRERAVLCGGRAAAGPRPGGGWSVEATLPLQKGVLP
jgi:signal transduction histidine kinase